MTRLHAPALLTIVALTAGLAPQVAFAGESDQLPVASAEAVTPSRAGLAAAAAGGPTTKLSAAAFQTKMNTTLTSVFKSPYLRGRTSGVVVDASTGASVWRSQVGVTRMPASTMKLLTAYTTLRSIEPAAVLTTRAVQSTAVPANLYLVGDGDPTLSYWRLKQTAQQAAGSLVASGRKSVTLYIDDTVFPAPTMALGWKASYYAGDVQRVRGLTLAGYRGADGGAAAAKAFVTYLKGYGVTATYRGRAKAPQTGQTIGSTDSATVRSIVGVMLSVSSNDYAEYLLRQAARSNGLLPTWRNALATSQRILGENGVRTLGLKQYDGSGLSRANRMPVATLTDVVGKLWTTPGDREIAFAWGAMPRSGQTGTLKNRFKTAYQRCAQGRVLAKTGTLGDAVALAGVTLSSDGKERYFAFVENGLRGKTASVRSAVDTAATTVVGCRLG